MESLHPRYIWIQCINSPCLPLGSLSGEREAATNSLTCFRCTGIEQPCWELRKMYKKDKVPLNKSLVPEPTTVRVGHVQKWRW